MKKLKYSSVFLLVCLITGCTSKKIPATQSIPELDAKMETLFAASTLPGVSVIVVDKDTVLYQKSMGFADVASQQMYTGTTVQNIASISKTFIGVSLMKAVDLGKLSLDDPINEYLPFKVIHPLYPETPITIRHLTTHTSSINDSEVYGKSYVLNNPHGDFSYLPSEILNELTFMKRNKSIDDSQYLEQVLSEKGVWYDDDIFTNKPPGKKYHYSNIGATLAAHVLENAVGMTYEAFTRQYIFDPLQMNQTHWEDNKVAKNKRATNYFTKDLQVPKYSLVTFADGGLLTCSTDFGKYLIEMINGLQGQGRLLSNQSYKELFNRQKLKGGSSGVFWGVSAKGNPNHSGGDPGTLTNTVIVAKSGRAIYLVTNTDSDINQEAMPSIISIWKTIAIHNWN